MAAYVEQILDVLTDNALSVSPTDTTVVLRVAATPDGGGRLVVADEGPGMTPDDRSRAFGRRWQAQDRDGGSGLGLAIALRLADACRATLTLDEAATGGLEAAVTLGRAPTS